MAVDENGSPIDLTQFQDPNQNSSTFTEEFNENKSGSGFQVTNTDGVGNASISNSPTVIKSLSDKLTLARQKAAAAIEAKSLTNKSYAIGLESEDLVQITPHEPLVPGSGVYPAKLNFDTTTKKPIITENSVTIEEHIYSIKYQAASMDAVHPSDITPNYPNPNFPKSLIEPDPDKDPDGLLFDDTELIQKLGTFATDENFDGVLKQPSHAINWKALLPDLNAMTLEGDPRWSLGNAVQDVFQEFWPKTQAYIDFLNKKNITIINDYICDMDGTPIEKVSEEALARYNTITGFNSSVSAPPLPTPQAINDFFDKRQNIAYNRHADGFIKYIREAYLEQGYFVESYYYHPIRLFVLKTYVTNYTGQILSLTYFKYYADRIDYVVQGLKIPFTLVTKADIPQVFNDSSFKEQIENPIPDYTKYL